MIKDDLEIFLITYNRIEKLKYTLKKILESPIKDFDIKILDNFSDDGTKEFCDKFAKQYKNFVYIRNKINLGISGNIIRAMELASKKWLWILCDDDDFDWNNWNEIEQALDSDDYDIVHTTYTEGFRSEEYSYLINEEAFVPTCIYNTKHITPLTIQNGYAIAYTLLPHHAIGCKVINEKGKIFVPQKRCVLQGESDKLNFIRMPRKGLFHKIDDYQILAGYIGAYRLIEDEEVRSKCNSILCLGQSFKNSMYWFLDNNPRNNLHNIFEILINVNDSMKRDFVSVLCERSVTQYFEFLDKLSLYTNGSSCSYQILKNINKKIDLIVNRPTFLQQVFSVRNEGNHKVLRILGLKIKFRKKNAMMEQPLVSVFIPYYNDEKFLRQSIESVLNQTYPNWELILFNHASTDNSRNIAHSYKDKRIKHIDVSENLGAGSGLNLWNSLPYIKGEYVKVFSADDVMYTDHLDILVKYLELNKDKDFVISTFADYIDENDKILSKICNFFKKYPFNDKDPFEWQLINSYFNASSLIVWGGGLVRKSALRNVCKDNSMIYRFDMSFWIALLLDGKKIGCINQSLMQYRKHRESAMFQDYKKIAITCFFEHLPFLELFYSIKDLNLIKYLCKDVPRSVLQKVHKFDADLIEFLLSLRLFRMTVPKRTFPQPELINLSYKICAYQHLYRLFQNRNSLEKIKTTFGFTIRDFRDMYSSVKELIERAPKNDELSFAQTIFSIKNFKDRQYKVITILGIRLKFRRKI